MISNTSIPKLPVALSWGDLPKRQKMGGLSSRFLTENVSPPAIAACFSKEPIGGANGLALRSLQIR